jgi:hypothetical protein
MMDVTFRTTKSSICLMTQGNNRRIPFLVFNGYGERLVWEDSMGRAAWEGQH